MKKNIQTKVIYSLLIVFILYMLYGLVEWQISRKTYALACVYDFVAMQGPASPAKYYYEINNVKYFGSSGSSGNHHYNKYFIIEVIKSNVKISRIEIEIPIDPQKLQPQPPEGWDECPINEDGSIKEEYRR